MAEKLKNLEEMQEYIESKFSSEFFDAKATTEDKFGPQVKWTILWTPKVRQFEPCSGVIWAAPSFYTSAVPFMIDRPDE